MALEKIGKAAYIIVGIEANKAGKRIKEADQVKAHENVLDRLPSLTFISSGGSWRDPATGEVIVENGRIYLHIGATFIEQAESVAEYIRDAYNQTASVLVWDNDGYICE
jgi:hypothetical protein